MLSVAHCSAETRPEWPISAALSRVNVTLDSEVQRAVDPVLELFPGARGSGCRAWIRTMNNASKGRCVTVTPRGKGQAELVKANPWARKLNSEDGLARTPKRKYI